MSFNAEPVEVYQVAGGPYTFARWIQIGSDWHRLEAKGDVHLDGVMVIVTAAILKDLGVTWN